MLLCSCTCAALNCSWKKENDIVENLKILNPEPRVSKAKETAWTSPLKQGSSMSHRDNELLLRQVQ